MTTQTIAKHKTTAAGHYARVNGLNMYYEIHGSGHPLVLIHGGGSTINTTFGHILPALAEKYQVIAVELQAHGRTADIDRPLSFEQDADDVAALLQQLHIKKVHVFGFSNGGSTAMQIAIRHPVMVDKLVIASAFYKREGMYTGFWEMMEKATFADMPQVYKDAYLAVNNDTTGVHTMFNRDQQRMVSFKDWKDDDIRAIHAPALVLAGDRDVMTAEHTAAMCRLMPAGRLMILPSTHGEYIGELATIKPGSKLPELTVAVIEEFLDEPAQMK
ncbi:alpha/beta fold hydrolase [Chitinophagaceae bacterium MMS25-I14]